MSVSEVAAWFGVDRKTVYSAVSKGHIPHQRLGKRVLLHRDVLVRWLSKQGSADGR